MREDGNEARRTNVRNNRNRRKKQKQIRMLILGLLGFSVVMLVAGVILGKVWGSSSANKVVTEEMESVQSELETLQAEQAADDALDAELEAKKEELETAWYLRLINQSNFITEDEVVELSEVEGYQVDSRIVEELEAMLADVRAEGIDAYIRSAYREWDTQALYFSNMIELHVNSGCTYYEAYVNAAAAVAVPGESEHQLGLALDIISTEYEELDDGQADTDVARWLEANSYKYGFILRYPEGKEDITGIQFEPWHYRYVGVEAATEITELGITLEEYHEMYNG